MLLLVALSTGLLCPVALAAEPEHGRRDEPPASAESSAAVIDTVPVGPPEPNGCRPYCR